MEHIAPPKAAAAIWTGQPCQIAANALEEDGSPPRRPCLDRGKAALLRVDVGQIEPRWLSSAPSSAPPSARSRPGDILLVDLGRIEDGLRIGWPERGRAALLRAALGRIEVRRPLSSVDSASARVPAATPPWDTCYVRRRLSRPWPRRHLSWPRSWH